MKTSRFKPATLARSLLGCFTAAWMAHSPAPSTTTSRGPAPAALAKDDDSRTAGDAIAELRRRRLRLPLDNVIIAAMKGQFGEAREHGARGHEAVDLLAPRGTPVHAIEDGTIAKLFLSKAGGNTVYQFDPSGRYCYYYAHLQRYGDIREGQSVKAGDTIGYVGTSGNAPPDTPHLHLAIFVVARDGQWWSGRPLDPYQVYGG